MSVAAFWSAVWPNLAANVLWGAPLWAWHHSRLRRHIQDEVSRVIAQLEGK